MASSVITPLAIALGAIPGALSRYYITQYCTRRWGSHFPYGTLWINLSGTVLIGMGSAWIQTMEPSSPFKDWVKHLVIVGFLGAYTTFSTYELETLGLLKVGRTRTAVLYGLGSAVLGILGVEIGQRLVSWMR